MIRHLLKLVWNRKRANALLIVEIFFSFAVLFGVLTLAAATYLRWTKPLGFDYRNVWRGTISFPPQSSEMKAKDEAEQRAAVAAMIREARTLPEVESIGAVEMPPYSQAMWISGLTVNGHDVDVTRDTATDDYARVMHIRPLRGRWFISDDDSAAIPPMVIDSDAAMALFGTIDVAGRIAQSGPKEIYRVVGVIAPYRKNGELSADQVKMTFERASLTTAHGHVPRELMIRVRAGTPAEFEETLVKRLHGIAPTYTLRVQHMQELRTLMNRIWLAPAAIGGVIAAFLLIMVALGLSGVLWQTVTQRRRELGLRRAVGATGAAVNRQILSEVALLTTLALIAGVIVIAQLPLLGSSSLVTPASFMIGIASALVTIYILTLLCALYPSWLAGKVQPAHALHYE